MGPLSLVLTFASALNPLRYGEPLYILLYLFAVVVAMGLVSILVGLLANKKAADPVRMEHDFYLARTRWVWWWWGWGGGCYC